MKLLSYLVIILVLTIAFNGITQSFGDTQMDAFLKIATKARDNLKNEFSENSNISSEVIFKFKQGSNETDALSMSVNKQDIASSREHFLSAMKFFKQANDQLNSLNNTSNIQTTEKIQLQNQISKVEQIGHRLKTIAMGNNVNFNFTQFDLLLQKAKQEIDTGNIKDATLAIQKTHAITLEAHHSITEAANQRTFDRAKDFAAKQIERLDKLNSQTQNTTKLAPHPSALNSTLENAKDTADMMKKLVAEGKVSEALKIIQAYEKYMEKNSHLQQNSTNSTYNPSNMVNANESKLSASGKTNPQGEIEESEHENDYDKPEIHK